MVDASDHRPSSEQLCGVLHPQRVFDHYAYGDMLPVYARFVCDDDDPDKNTAAGGITIYVACQREQGHNGMHLASSNRGWH